MSAKGDSLESTSKVVEIIQQEVAIFKNLIKERKHPLDLVRELLSNAGAKEVGATLIEISYTKDREGHIFEVVDDGCGMNHTGRKEMPGRLDKFLGLGLSGIVGQKSDEFSWKGLGSKLAYQSRRVEITTRFGNYPLYEVKINEPWSSLDRNLLPKPRISDFPESDDEPGTRIRVYGHPPHRLEEPFTMDEIKTFLLHRTFAGFTRDREHKPEIVLSVLGQTETLEFGFPEFKGIIFGDGIELDEERKTLFVNIIGKGPNVSLIRLKGFLTWNADQFDLSKDNLNTGLILSSKGIPYFKLDMREYGARTIVTARPGESKTCLVIECDGIYSEMNISRSDLVDSGLSLEFKKEVAKLFEKLETSEEYLSFRQVQTLDKLTASGKYLAEEKVSITSDDQTWVVYQKEDSEPIVLIREPRNETEVNALLWKMEAIGALPFEQFQTLAYPGVKRGPDLFANFQEEPTSEPIQCAVFEIENNFYSYKSHGHYPGQYPKVICWDIPASGRKVRLNKTAKKFKLTFNTDEYQVHVFVLRMMDGIKVMTKKELRDFGIQI